MGSATSSMAAKLAFHPPNPPSYSIITDEESGKKRLSCTRLRQNVDVLEISTARHNTIVAVFAKNPLASLTILYSHGNATDLGQMLSILLELSDSLGVNLMGYDYSGYGQSSGKASEQDTYADIEACYRSLGEVYGLKEEDIILYGQSLGSGPTLELAAKLPHLRAVVLHSAFLSGLRVMYSVNRTYWFDIFKNVDKIPLLTCPVLVIHGSADEVVPFSHGKKLFQLCKEKYEPFWVEGGGHCNLELHPHYLTHLKKFTSAVEKQPKQAIPSHQSAVSIGSSNDSKESSRMGGLDHEHRSRHSVDSAVRVLDHKHRSRHSVDSAVRRPRLERERKSVDGLGKHRNSVDKPDRPRKSFDRFGDMVRSVGLCNVDCFK